MLVLCAANQCREIEAEKEDRTVRDGEIVTACSKPAHLKRSFSGNINDPQSAVSRLKKKNLNYSLLEELNTRPRKRIRRDCVIRIRSSRKAAQSKVE